MKQLTLIVLIFLGISLNLRAKTIYVKTDAKGDKNGTTWSMAYSDIQNAIKNAKQGDEIWVSKGIYYPTTGNDKSSSFKLKEKISLYGGFNGTETILKQRDWDLNPTIMSGNIGDRSINTDNSTHVVITADNAILDGFIVEDGYAISNHNEKGKRQGDSRTEQQMGRPQTHTSPQNISQSTNTNSGAGILNFKTCATIRNTTIRNCSAGKGGGVYNMTNSDSQPNGNSSSPLFINVKFQGNYAMMRGGGMENDMGTNPVIIQCEFTNNTCGAKGGALYNDFGCSPIILSSLFKNNQAHDAAAIGNDGSSCPIIIDTKIIGNIAESEGAGLYQGSYNANMRGKGNIPLVINSIVKNNQSTTNGLANISLWGEDWIDAWNSDIEEFNYSLDQLDQKYDGLIEITNKIKSLDAETIDQLYAENILEYININASEKVRGEGNKGFGTNNILTQNASIPQKVIYVKNNTTNGDGQSWDSAFNNLQYAIDKAQKEGGAEIWLAAGTYKPTTDNNRNASFVMHGNIAIYGGFAGNEVNKSDRNHQINKTILSGNIGNKKSVSDNSFHVVTGSVNSIIDGVTIADGFANGKVTNRYGGGLYCWGYESSSIIRNCIFTNNFAEDGGAVFCFADVLSYFENVTFENNTAFIGGAASFRFGSSCQLDNCTFVNNSASSRAGAVCINYGSNVIINNTTFNQNRTTGNGGAIWVNDQASQYGGTQPVITDCSFSENKAEYYGGAIQNYNISTSIIQNCKFSNNKAEFGNDISNNLRCQVSISKNAEIDIYNDESSTVNETANSEINNKKQGNSKIENQSNSTINKTLDDVNFSVTIIGSGSPQYNPERSQPSALFQYKGIKFLVDMGNGTQDQLQKLGFTGKNSPDALLLTHHHIDHNGEFISMVHSQLMTNKEFLIAGLSPIEEMTNYVTEFYREDLNYRLSNKGKTIDDVVKNETIKVLEPGDSFEYKGVKVSTIEVPHTIKTIAYRFDADGKSIVISGDLSYTENLQKLAKDVDILVIDGKVSSGLNNNKSSNQNKTNNTRQQNSKSGNKAHASLEEIAKMAVASNAKTMVLTHLGTQVANAEATSKSYSDLGFKGNVTIAADFLTITTEGENFMLSEQPFATTSKQTTKRSNKNNLSGNKQNTNRTQNSDQQRNPMARLDSNGDNKISTSEAKGPLKENFSEIDINKDGFITTDEINNRVMKN
jgi:predicted outer membrane repeat protein